jgi:hemoglobin-like flavoprotein
LVRLSHPFRRDIDGKAMTRAQKDIVQRTWALVVPIADFATAMFYDRLFEIDRSTTELFQKTDLAQQRLKLLQVLSVAVAGLDDLDRLLPIVEDLGRRHASYGVKDEHYDSVGAALLWTLQRGLGAAWSDETAAAWTEVYGVLSGTMRRAQKDAAPTAA